MEQPLLSGEARDKKDEGWRSYQHVGRNASVHFSSPATGGEEVSADEIKAASIFSESIYPPSIHGALVSSPESYHHQDQVIASQAVYGRDPHGYAPNEFGRQILDEVEIRHLLADHVGHHFCWGSRPARTWKIVSIEDCNVYVGTLETFIEERETVRVIEPYSGGEVDGKNQGATEPAVWELDLRSEFPLLFVPYKETNIKIPHSEALEKCAGCEGRGELACPTCNAGQEPGHYKPNQMSQCSACHGRGLIAHQDGSDSICKKCNGTGKLPCVACGSRGLVKCQTCSGHGSLLTHNTAHVQWRTLSTRKVAASSGAASVPDEVFHNARGVQLYNTQAYQCAPAFFADSYLLNRFSSEVMAERSPIPPSARLICERHLISVVPVTRVTMAYLKRSFSFYIVGYARDIYIRDYPSEFCWGLCCCFEWLKSKIVVVNE
ncbi:protein SSUH2 homolog [Phalaenopsis equestris]|uniref:protein SSUH2 homolog n=1 Tax=Phalaenopsis equestris TaxID=78828 RepID=UPI0009E58D89|nr:protein SSUH2 homolog [Phalaenopsis equestris]